MTEYHKISEKDLLAKYRPIKKISKQKWYFKASVKQILNRETSAIGSVFYNVQFWNDQTALIPANRLRKRYYQLIEDFELEAFKNSENKKLANTQKKTSHNSLAKSTNKHLHSAASKTKSTKKTQPLKSSVSNTVFPNTPSQLPISGLALSTPEPHSSFKSSSRISPHESTNASSSKSLAASQNQSYNTSAEPLSKKSTDKANPWNTPISSENMKDSASLQIGISNNNNNSGMPTEKRSISLNTAVPTTSPQAVSLGRIRLSQPSTNSAFYAITNKKSDQKSMVNQSTIPLDCIKLHSRICFECHQELYPDETQNNTSLTHSDFLFCLGCSFACHKACRKDRQSFNLTSFMCRMCSETDAINYDDPVFRCITCTGVFSTTCRVKEECPGCIAFKSYSLDTILSHRTREKTELLVKWKNRSYRQLDWIDLKLIETKYPDVLSIFLANQDTSASTNKELFPSKYVIPDRILDVRQKGNNITEIFVVYPLMEYKDAFWDTPPSKDNSEVYGGYIKALYRRKKEYFKPPKALNDKDLQRLRQNLFCPIQTQEDSKHGFQLTKHHIERLNYLLWFWHQKASCVVFDEAGLGKKFQAIAFMNVLSKKFGTGPSLLVVPNKAIPGWILKLERWASDLVCVPCFNDNDSWKLALRHEMFGKNGEPEFNVIVLAFEYAQKAQELKNLSWATLIIDVPPELTKNHQACLEQTKDYRRDTLILWDRYVSSDPPVYGGHPLLPIENPFIAKLIQRTKQDVLNAIPTKQETVIPVSLTPLQIEICKKLARKAIHVEEKDKNVFFNKLLNHPYLIEGVERHKAPSVDLYAEMIRDSGKLALLARMLPILKEKNHKIVIVCSLTAMLDMIANFLSFVGIQFVCISKASTLDQNLDRFNSVDSKIQVALFSSNADVYLARADTTIFWDDHSEDPQPVGCAYRMGQSIPTEAYRFKNTFPSAKQAFSLAVGNGSCRGIDYSRQDLERLVNSKQSGLLIPKTPVAADTDISHNNANLNLAQETTTKTLSPSLKRSAESQLLNGDKKKEKPNSLSEQQTSVVIPQNHEFLTGTAFDSSDQPNSTSMRSQMDTPPATLELPSKVIIPGSSQSPINVLDDDEQNSEANIYNTQNIKATEKMQMKQNAPSVQSTKGTQKTLIETFQREALTKRIAELSKTLKENMASVFEKHCETVQMYLIDCGRTNTSKILYDKFVLQGVNQMVTKLNQKFHILISNDLEQMKNQQIHNTILALFTKAFDQNIAIVLSQFWRWKEYNEPKLLRIGKGLQIPVPNSAQSVNSSTITAQTIAPTTLLQETVDKSNTPYELPIQNKPVVHENLRDHSVKMLNNMPPEKSGLVCQYVSGVPSNTEFAKSHQGVWDKQIQQSQVLLSKFLSLPTKKGRKPRVKKAASPKTENEQPTHGPSETPPSSQSTAITQTLPPGQGSCVIGRRPSNESIDILN
ncbi:hypothetical protein BY458DRAFT_489564 [Sporodiniella umbellata]|nr:hypothetical protein BY458DRAFT_489564 [Sporodiniella umbellata]